MEVGQSSGSISPDQVWAKLVPSKPSYESIDISSSDMMVSSHVTSTLQKLEWCQILRNSDRCSATIINKSSNAMLVDGAVLQIEEAVGIKCGSEIVPAAVKEGNLSYKFEVMPMQEECPGKNLKLFIDADHAKCSICLNIWHDVVTVAPCLHNFCNGCFSQWLRRCQEKHSSVLCPQCRAVVQFVGRNHFLRNIEEDILLADVSLQRSKEELAALDSYSSIKSNLERQHKANHQAWQRQQEANQQAWQRQQEANQQAWQRQQEAKMRTWQRQQDAERQAWQQRQEANYVFREQFEAWQRQYFPDCPFSPQPPQ